ncbi:hypothetical protein CAEBREN_09566 [Caenorhabditis brenneri]|uniref:Uncharacterized protein n=1 Tax=Caenorhabditis brenneri TaxID=135651 RepID=G0M9V1_CAEBE|nr:hypothetical protein CAEBREN_09566 [Caenorhabditis brenneri]
MEPSIENILDNLTSTVENLMVNETLKEWELAPDIPDFEYFYGMMTALFMAYWLVCLVYHFVFKSKDRKKTEPFSSLLAHLCEILESLLMHIQLAICAFIAFKILLSGFIVYSILFTIVTLMAVIRMTTEIYLLVLCVFVIVKFFSHFNYGSAEMAPNFWRFVIGVTGQLVSMKDFGLLIYALIAFANQDSWEKLFVCYSMTTVVLHYYNFSQVGDGILSAFFIFSDILWVPIVVRMAEILMAFKKPEMVLQEKIAMAEKP